MNISIIILCAGNSSRMGNGKSKILLPLGSKLVFMHSYDLLKKYSDDIIVVCNEGNINEISKYQVKTVLGGKTRSMSVFNGIEACKNENILVHDGARPFISDEDVKKIILAMDSSDSAFLGSKMVNSIKDRNTMKNLNRDDYLLAYTPQYVKKSDYLFSYKKAKDEGYEATDDVSLVQKYLGKKPAFIEGKSDNIKITTMDDYFYAKKTFLPAMRVGYSYDIHQLVEGRKLILGGIDIPYEKGLLGHSDADVLTHAIAESLLGALALGDLGGHFPDNDPKYKNVCSLKLLEKVMNLVDESGYCIGNIDSMIFAEQPKLNKYIVDIRKSLSNVLKIDIDLLSIKATTNEKLDSIGQGRAIASSATVLLFRKN